MNTRGGCVSSKRVNAEALLRDEAALSVAVALKQEVLGYEKPGAWVCHEEEKAGAGYDGGLLER